MPAFFRVKENGVVAKYALINNKSYKVKVENEVEKIVENTRFPKLRGNVEKIDEAEYYSKF